jgi:hypothetical protein
MPTILQNNNSIPHQQFQLKQQISQLTAGIIKFPDETKSLDISHGPQPQIPNPRAKE